MIQRIERTFGIAWVCPVIDILLEPAGLVILEPVVFQFEWTCFSMVSVEHVSPLADVTGKLTTDSGLVSLPSCCSDGVDVDFGEFVDQVTGLVDVSTLAG